MDRQGVSKSLQWDHCESNIVLFSNDTVLEKNHIKVKETKADITKVKRSLLFTVKEQLKPWTQLFFCHSDVTCQLKVNWAHENLTIRLLPSKS